MKMRNRYLGLCFLFVLVVATSRCTIIDKEHDNGLLIYECQVKWPSYKKNGWCKFYDRQGKIKLIANYADDKLEGEEIYYYSNGNVKHRVLNSKGKLWNIIEYKNRLGEQYEYGTFKDGNGWLKVYSGNYIKAEGMVVDGLKEGYWKIYRLGTIVDSNFFKNGINTEYPNIDFIL